MRQKVAFVLSAGKNTRLEDIPVGGKAHVPLRDGTPWQQAKAILERCGYVTYLVEWQANVTGAADFEVQFTNGPGWTVAECMEKWKMTGGAWDSSQLIVWYGDTVMDRNWTLPADRGNYVVCAQDPPTLGRNWDWATPTPTRLTYERVNDPGSRKVAVGIYHIQYPEEWLRAFYTVCPDFLKAVSARPDQGSIINEDHEIGMAEAWNRYGDQLKTVNAAPLTRFTVPTLCWTDVGDADALSTYEQRFRTNGDPAYESHLETGGQHVEAMPSCSSK